MSTTGTKQRQSAEERREAVIAAARREFAARGLEGTSTEDIARAAGISQPYLFRLFGTKKELYLASVERSSREIYELFAEASRGLTGVAALSAMGDAYAEMIQDRTTLLLMLQSLASCDDAEIREAVRGKWRDLVRLVEGVSGESQEVVSHFFASGMLLNVLTAMRLFDDPTEWGDRLAAGCISWLQDSES
jgi:AcrR family transcriptional regulator